MSTLLGVASPVSTRQHLLHPNDPLGHVELLSSGVCYLHFPKCGSSFLNTVARFACSDPLPQDCNFLPEYAPYRACLSNKTGYLYRLLHGENYAHVYRADVTNSTPSFETQVPGECSKRLFPQFWVGHEPFGSEERGQVYGADGRNTLCDGRVCPADATVTMVRSPNARFVSAPTHPTGMPDELWAVTRDHPVLGQLPFPPSVMYLLPGKAGCMTKQLTGRLCGSPLINDAAVAATIAMIRNATTVDEVRQQLQDGSREEQRLLAELSPTALDNLANLAFVGLTDEWELSVKLFHARFGGKAADVELTDTRPHSWYNGRNGQECNAATVDFVDRADESIYEAALQRFSKEAKLAGLATPQLSKARRTICDPEVNKP